MKKYILLLGCLIGVSSINAQQIALNSQYMFNSFAINPAVAGTKNYSPLTFTFRRQWMGIDEAPVTQNLMAHTYIGKNAGAGLHFYNDASGPTRRTGISTALSYQIKTGSLSKLSFGLSGSLTQFVIDRNRLITEIPNDVAVLNNTNNRLIPDFNFGMYWFSERHYFGLTAFHLLESKSDLFNLTTTVTNTLNRAVYGNAGYIFTINSNFAIEPSAVFRYMLNAPYQADANLRFIIMDSYWLAGSYRLDDAVAIMIGADFGPFELGYSYDMGMSDLSTYNTGSHEVYLGIKMNKDAKNKTPWHMRNRVYSSFSTKN
jgi:type IX secretion system PorP/SprF family membrane protein